MQKKPGEETGIFGHWLTHYFEDSTEFHQYLVYYDHGDAKSNKNVVAIKGLYGDEISRQNQLAQIDIMVVNPNNEVMLLIEIEEREGSPKKFVGDLFAILMCNRISIRLDNVQHYFKVTAVTKLIIAGIVPAKGSKLRQIEDVILPRLKQFDSPEDSINPRNVTFIFTENIESTISILKKNVSRLFF